MDKNTKDIKKHKSISAQKIIKRQFMEMLDIPLSKAGRDKQMQNYREFVQHLFSDQSTNENDVCVLADES